MKISATLNGNSFQVEDLVQENVAPVVDLFRTWLNAQQSGSVAGQIEEMTGQLKSSQDQLEEAVNAAQPKEQ